MIARWFTNLRVFFVWLLGFALMLVIMALGHELIMSLVVNTLHGDRYIVRLVYVVYFTLAGIICVAYYIMIHEFLSISAKKGRLLRNSLLTIGSQLLLIVLLQLGLLAYQYFPGDAFFFALATLEGLAAVVMLFFALRKTKRST